MLPPFQYMISSHAYLFPCKISMISSNTYLTICKTSMISPNAYLTTGKISMMSSNAYLYTFKTSICDISILLLKCLMINCDKNAPQSINQTSVCFYKDRGKTLSIIVKCNVNIPSIDGEICLATFFSLAY